MNGAVIPLSTARSALAVFDNRSSFAVAANLFPRFVAKADAVGLQRLWLHNGGSRCRGSRRWRSGRDTLLASWRCLNSRVHCGGYDHQHERLEGNGR